MNAIAVVESFDDQQPTLHVYPDTPAGKREAEAMFRQLVGDDLDECAVPGDDDQAKIIDELLATVDGDPTYNTGGSAITLQTTSVTLHDDGVRSSRKPVDANYRGTIEVVPGVFIAVGDAVYIHDEHSEVATWNYDELVNSDGEAFTAALCAVALAAVRGPEAVRRNIQTKGAVLDSLIADTAGL